MAENILEQAIQQDTPPASDNKVSQEIIQDGKVSSPSSGEKALEGIFDSFANGEDPFAGAKADDAVVVDDFGDGKPAVKAVDEVPAVVVADKPAVVAGDKPAVVPEDYSDLSDEDLTPSPLDKPKTARRINALLNRVKETANIVATTKAELAEKATKLADLERKLSESGSSSPEVQKQVDELSMFRRRYQLETDPEVKSKFDDVIASREADIVNLLKENSAGEGLINLITSEGGLVKFARLNKSYKLTDGSSVSAKALFNRIRDSLTESNPADALALDAAIQEQSRLSADKNRYIESEKARSKEYFSSQEKAQQERSATIKTKIDTFLSKLATEDNDFKELAVPADATPAKIAELKEENVYRKQLRDIAKSSIGITDEEYLNMVRDSTLLYPVKRSLARSEERIKAQDAEIARLKEDLDKVRGASSTVPKRGVISTSKADAPKATKAKTLEEEFDAIGGGE